MCRNNKIDSHKLKIVVSRHRNNRELKDTKMIPKVTEYAELFFERVDLLS